MRFDRPRPLTAAQQFLDLKRDPIAGSGRGRLRAGRLVWDFEVQPTPLSRLYGLRLTYPQCGNGPEVVVVAPNLGELADGRKLPHVYRQSPPRLCLYLPGAGEWAAHERLSQTAVPWAALWLFYFEEWLSSDEWKGGGVHPDGSHDRH